jgi:hypothetical protein
MTRDDILRMAREAHRRLVTEDYPGHTGQLDPWTMALLERFAALVTAAERTRSCRIVTGLCISDNNAREINEAIRMQAADRLARHGIQISEDEEYGNPSF